MQTQIHHKAIEELVRINEKEIQPQEHVQLIVESFNFHDHQLKVKQSLPGVCHYFYPHIHHRFIMKKCHGPSVYSHRGDPFLLSLFIEIVYTHT